MPFNDFSEQVLALVDKRAADKGYNQTGPDGKNALFEFVREMGLSHAEGEIVYKVVRYHQKRDPEDLLKAAAWAFLLWRYTGDKPK
jgi:hypothetical protein